jgi:tRNA(Ile)-lysidine synthase TilS/MesJ
MDTSDEDIQFDKDGVCNHCKELKNTIDSIQCKNPQEHLNDLIKTIKSQSGKYNCLIGTSGGKDSTFLIVKCIEWGLKPLLVHIDNGWNTELAVSNIKKVATAYNLDLETFVLDWSEFKQIQLAFLKSSTVDLEMPTDLAISAGLYKLASKHNINYIVSAGNYASEGILPLTWGYHVLKDTYY